MLQIERIAFAVILGGFALLAHTCKQQDGKSLVHQWEESETAIPENTAEAEKLFEEASEQTRVALIEPCGRCHQSTLKTHKAAAIAFFDLDQGENWHMDLDEDNLEGLAGRANSNKAISDTERENISLFITLKKAKLK
ncbi:hypothetical protein [Poritiphilus flavus]|uniref:Cytochrome c domain-containing protein n=1 Tax=Poritiphilus flavus TaxID=2697053 RepID=A0A6L9EF55_9FLAO|nr:hypothetical protein [Poritiphilus flavus]NAS13283.1 hypothetical protein [Poritiphilus flavus]